MIFSSRQRRRRSPHCPANAVAPLAAALMLAAAGNAGAASGWHGQVGVAAVHGPEYLGAEEERSRILPLVNLRYGERLYLGNSRFSLGAGVGWQVAHGQGWRWGAELLATPGREADDADSLAGTEDRDTGAVAATGLGYRHGIFRTSLSLGIGLTEDAGLAGRASLGVQPDFGGRLTASLSLSAVVADSDNMHYDYGISDEEAVRRAALLAAGDPRLRPSEAGPYDPDAGLKEIRLGLRLGYVLTPSWQVGSFIGWAQLQGDAADSPLARERSAVAGGVSLGYRF